MSTISRNSWHYKFTKAIPVFQAHYARGLCSYVRRLIVQFSVCGLLLFMEARFVWDLFSGWNPVPTKNLTSSQSFLQFLHMLSDALAFVVFVIILLIVLVTYVAIPVGEKIVAWWQSQSELRRTRSGQLPLGKRAQRRLKFEELVDQLFTERYSAFLRDRTGTVKRPSWEECRKEARLQLASPFCRMMMEYGEAIHNKICPILEFKD